MPAGCSRARREPGPAPLGRSSELIRRAGELGDPVAHQAGLRHGERGDLVRAGRGVEHDGREPEPLLQQVAPVSTCWTRSIGTSVRVTARVPRRMSISCSRTSQRQRRQRSSGTTTTATAPTTSAAIQPSSAPVPPTAHLEDRRGDERRRRREQPSRRHSARAAGASVREGSGVPSAGRSVSMSPRTRSGWLDGASDRSGRRGRGRTGGAAPRPSSWKPDALVDPPRARRATSLVHSVSSR